MKKYLVFTLIFVFGVNFSFGQSASALYNTAKDNVAKGKDSLAVVNITLAINQSPDKTDWLNLRAGAYERLKEYDKALADYSASVKKANKDIQAFQGLALCDLHIKKFQDAISTSDQSIKINSSLPNILSYAYKAMAQDSLRDYAGERTTLLLAIGLIKKDGKAATQPAYKTYFISLGDAGTKTGNYKEALDNYTIALKMDPGNTAKPHDYYVNYLIANASLLNQDYIAALNVLNASIIKYDSLPESFYCRGIVFKKISQYKNSISDFTHAILLRPNYYKAYAERAACYGEMLQYDNALADYEKSIAIYNKDTAIMEEYKQFKIKAFESKRTFDPPVVKFNYPDYDKQKNELEIPYDKTETFLDLTISDKSKIDSIIINNKQVSFDKEQLDPKVDQNIKIDTAKTVTISVVDVYKNRVQISPKINRVNPFTKTDTVDMQGIILADNLDRTPLKSARITLLDKDGNIMSTLVMDKTGTFKFKILKPEESYSLSIESDDAALANVKGYIVADKNGKSRMNVLKKNGKVKIDIIPYDPIILSLMSVEDFSINLELKGKLLLDEDKPLAKATVRVLDDDGAIIGNTVTNADGLFDFRKLPFDKAAFTKTITLDTANLRLSNGDKIYLSDDKGVTHSTVVFNKLKALKIQILAADRSSFTKIEDVDSWLKALKLSASQPVVTIVENINYPQSEYAVSDEAARILDKAVDLLNKNPHIKIEISSHTDSRGPEESNLTVSQKRAKADVDYIVSKGIASDRVSGEGFGDQRLVNKCSSGVTCSEEEHQQNLRTEFKVMYQ